MLTPDNPHEATPQKNHIRLKGFNELLGGRSKRHCSIEKGSGSYDEENGCGHELDLLIILHHCVFPFL